MVDSVVGDVLAAALRRPRPASTIVVVTRVKPLETSSSRRSRRSSVDLEVEARDQLVEAHVRSPDERAKGDLVVLPLGAQAVREAVMAGRLAGLPLLLEAAAQREVRVVVDGRDLDRRPELPLGFAEALDAEVGDPERLADRRLVRLPALRLLERDGRLGRPARPPDGFGPAGRGRTSRSSSRQ